MMNKSTTLVKLLLFSSFEFFSKVRDTHTHTFCFQLSTHGTTFFVCLARKNTHAHTFSFSLGCLSVSIWWTFDKNNEIKWKKREPVTQQSIAMADMEKSSYRVSHDKMREWNGTKRRPGVVYTFLFSSFLFLLDWLVASLHLVRLLLSISSWLIWVRACVRV